ncbi:nucleotidyl transferase AbiEii/AbiGii toxin family protein [Candidatus Aquiluna sp. UB-MaderosW2red]|uniref:nucleotidyl transferase AbiEii/AbiGii toxin family protein n=1 Tax=Candidatus Aquiluna sp. UB-MaderosW2red TaxID=1855377 RepID=UPI000875BF5F|nr:nucleotidyl transferase AbiEii/AbiGii toxin family protein [Candidatus Aquiluna sp. UB-MaderosW2red]SCX03260.1 Nucleotidyl transferase AbiEii toxin, Type IV TA system [Candidatus Aquiluna sp. UB-MaderosW2red]
MASNYSTPAALKQSFDARLRNSNITASQLVGAWHLLTLDRFLCRIFFEPESPYLLKGGFGMLARTANARFTKDLDLSLKISDFEKVISEITELARRDLRDYFRFEYRSHSSLAATDSQPDREARRIFFDVSFGGRPEQAIKIDLSVDQVLPREIKRTPPAGRVLLPGLEVCDYLLYPLENQIADKVCASLATYRGVSSSRIKDFVDLVIILENFQITRGRMWSEIKAEAQIRSIELGIQYVPPGHWQATYAKASNSSKMSSEHRDWDSALDAVSRFVDFANDTKMTAIWDPAQSRWV